MDIVQEIRQAVAEGLARLRATLSAVTLTDTPGLIQEAVSGKKDVTAEVRRRWNEDCDAVSDAIIQVVAPMLAAQTAQRKLAGQGIAAAASASTAFDERLARRMLRLALRNQAGRQPPPKQPALDIRPVLHLADGQTASLQATTLAALKVPLHLENIAEIWDDPDDPDNIIEGPPVYRPAYANVGTPEKPEMIPIYGLPAFPLGLSPVYDRHRTLAVIGDDGELVDAGIPNPYAASSHFTHHKGDPPGCLRWQRNHRRYNAAKWNAMFAKWLAALPAESEIGRRLDELALRVIRGQRVLIVTHEYAGHGQQVVDEILRRARAGVRAATAAPEQANLSAPPLQDRAKVRTPLREIGVTPQHWLDQPDRPQPGVTANPRFDWRSVVRIRGQLAYPLETGSSYVLAITGDSKLIEARPEEAQPVYGWWEKLTDAATGEEMEIWRPQRPAAATELWLLWQPILHDWFSDQSRSEGGRVQHKTLKRTIQAPTHGAITVYPARHHGQYVPAAERPALAERLIAEIDAEQRQAAADGRQPVHDAESLAYVHNIHHLHAETRTCLYEPVATYGRFDEHDQIIDEQDEEEYASHLTALYQGGEDLADLIHSGLDPEAAAEILRIGGRPRRRSKKTEQLDLILSKAYAKEEARIDYRLDAERNMLWNDWRKGEITEADLERYAQAKGYRDIRITCEPGLVADDDLRQELIEAGAGSVVKMHSAVAQLMGRPPVIVAIDGKPLTEAQQKAVNQGRRYRPTPTANGGMAVPCNAPFPCGDINSPRLQIASMVRQPAWAPRRRNHTCTEEIKLPAGYSYITPVNQTLAGLLDRIA